MLQVRLQPGQIGTIVTMAKNGVIGGENGLLWRLPADLKRFSQLTAGRPLIVGRRAYQSIGHTLSGKPTIVISRHSQLTVDEGVLILSDLDQALNRYRPQGCFVVGGGQMYEQTLDTSDLLFLTEMDVEPDGETFFHYNPSFWRELERAEHRADDQNQVDYVFRVLERIKSTLKR